MELIIVAYCVFLTCMLMFVMYRWGRTLTTLNACTLLLARYMKTYGELPEEGEEDNEIEEYNT